MGFYFVSPNRGVAENTKFFDGAIVIKNKKEGDVSFFDEYGYDINYNKMENFEKISEFFDKGIEIIKKKDKSAKFMFYNQAGTEFMHNLDDVVCINDIELIKKLNHKPISRKILDGCVDLLDYKYLRGDEITSFDVIDNLFGSKYEKYVIQQPVGFAGIGTHLIDSKNCKTELKKLKNDVIYSISGYISESVSINNAFMISDDDVIYFDGSMQLVNANEIIEYAGSDFDSYYLIEDNLQKKIRGYSMKIARRLQELGYRGICGIDYILADNHVYFMEVNPRFQASSGELDRRIISRGFPSLYELNYMSFYDVKAFKKWARKFAD